MTQQDLIEGGSQPMTAAANPLQMVQTALEKGLDAESIRQFMDLAREHQADQARHAYTEAMSRFRADCPPIPKTKKGHNGKYAPLDKAIETIKGIMAECGLSHSWRTDQKDGMIFVTCVVTHVDGHSEQTTLSSPPDDGGKMNSIQRIGSAVSYLQRYSFFSILGLASGDQDDDGQAAGQESDLIDESTQADIHAMVDEILKTPQERVNFSGYLKTQINAANGFIRNIPANRAADVVAALEKKRASS